jgi:subtilisin-like proprotein convertase family protein
MSTGRESRTLFLMTVITALIAPAAARGSQQYYESCIRPWWDPVPSCPGTPIPDNGTPLIIELYVPPDPAGENIIMDVNTLLWVPHSWQGDLYIGLISPDGTWVELVNRPGLPACGDYGFAAQDFGNIEYDPFFSLWFFYPFTLDSDAASFYGWPTVGCPGLYGGGYAGQPHVWQSSSLLDALNGESKVGTWQLHIYDVAGGYTGQFKYFALDIRTEPSTAPVAEIATPEDYACACVGGAVTGTAADPDGTFDSYSLDWATDSSGPWQPIGWSSTPVTNGTLGYFPNMPEGHQYVRLIATNSLGLSTTFVKVVHIDTVFGGADIRDPMPGDIIGGNVCIDASASDYCYASSSLAYKPASGGGWTTFFSTTDPGAEFPLWNTTGLPDGDYTLRVSGTTTCGNTASDLVNVTIDNTPPVGVIASPDNCDVLGDSVTIIGTATDAHFGGWVLQYTGGPTNGWQTIASGSSPVNNGVLATWDTSALPPCSYTLRLLVSDASTVSCIGSNSAEFLVSIELGSNCPADIDGSGDVSNGDLQMILDNWADVCPP